MQALTTIRSVALSLLLIVAAPLSATAQEGQPRIVVSNPTINFGKVEQGSPVDGVFDLKNEGTAPLQILGIQPACGCTATMLDAKTIEPGKVSQLKATLSTTDFSGQQAKKIRITTNDPQSRSVELTLQGEILPLITVDPPRLYLRKLDAGKELTQSFTVKLKPELNAQITEVIAGSDKVPTVRIPIFAYVVGAWKVLPETVSFGTVEGPLKEPLKKRVSVSHVGGEKYRVLSATANNPAIQTELFSGKEGEEAGVQISIAQSTVGMVRGEVVLQTDHPLPAQRSISIPVFINVAVKKE